MNLFSHRMIKQRFAAVYLRVNSSTEYLYNKMHSYYKTFVQIRGVGDYSFKWRGQQSTHLINFNDKLFINIGSFIIIRCVVGMKGEMVPLATTPLGSTVHKGVKGRYLLTISLLTFQISNPFTSYPTDR